MIHWKLPLTFYVLIGFPPVLQAQINHNAANDCWAYPKTRSTLAKGAGAGITNIRCELPVVGNSRINLK